MILEENKTFSLSHGPFWCFGRLKFHHYRSLNSYFSLQLVRNVSETIQMKLIARYKLFQATEKWILGENMTFLIPWGSFSVIFPQNSDIFNHFASYFFLNGLKLTKYVGNNVYATFNVNFLSLHAGKWPKMGKMESK